MTEGGIRIASVPEEAMRPALVGRSYPVSNNRGSASNAINTTEAPTMPEDAASNTPITRTEIPMPAAEPPSAACAALRLRDATPDFSSTRPMKMNIGIATSSQFESTFA